MREPNTHAALDELFPSAPPAPPLIETWNTGNLYSAHGQRIAATLLIDHKIAFLDLDRGISGILHERKPAHMSLKSFTNSEYRALNYESSLYRAGQPYAEFKELEDLLNAAAMTAPSLKKSTGQ